LFAVTTSQQCAEDLPYGPTDKLLPLTGEGGEDNPILASPAPGYDPALLKATKDKNGAPKTGFLSASGFLSVFNGDSYHLGFLQRHKFWKVLYIVTFISWYMY
jgi:hypothetical protein